MGNGFAGEVGVIGQYLLRYCLLSKYLESPVVLLMGNSGIQTPLFLKKHWCLKKALVLSGLPFAQASSISPLMPEEAFPFVIISFVKGSIDVS